MDQGMPDFQGLRMKIGCVIKMKTEKLQCKIIKDGSGGGACITLFAMLIKKTLSCSETFTLQLSFIMETKINL